MAARRKFYGRSGSKYKGCWRLTEYDDLGIRIEPVPLRF